MPHYAPHRLLACTLALGALAGMVLTPRAHAGEPAPFAAQAGLDIASEAARTWAADAELVYVENDEALGADGSAARWGYLFRSRAADASRAYSAVSYTHLTLPTSDLV